MARRKKSRKPATRPQTPETIEPTGRTAAVYLAALLFCTAISFFPLLRYFFAQDDFGLMLTAWRDGWGATASFFQQTPGMFRPLTKGTYFQAMYGLFGLNAQPYHFVSIVVHLANTVLVYVLLGRMKVSRAAALVAATLFALNVAFFHVIAWISCIQQLLGQLFMLAALIWGVDCAQSRSNRVRWLSLGAYILALLSLEQTFGVPVILFVYAWLSPGLKRRRFGLRRALVAYHLHLAVMVVYLLLIGVWKTAPHAGPYALTIGSNVAVNLLTYLGWSPQFGVALPSRMQANSVPWSQSHVFLFGLVAYQLVRRRWRELTFGLTYFVAAAFPTLFLTAHTYFLHTYIPLFGVLYLIGLVVDDLLALPRLRSSLVRLALLGTFLAAMATVSFVMVRENEHYKLFGFLDLPRSFVLRRAEIAKTMYDCIVASKPFDDKIEAVYLVYGREEGRDRAKWNNENVKASIGWGSMLQLVYGKPNLEVSFKVVGDSIHKDDLIDTDIYLYDDYGTCIEADKAKQN
jgi:hypothetical protein